MGKLGTVILTSALVTPCGGERGGVPAAEVRAAIADQIDARNDTLTLTDPRTEIPVLLSFDRVHEDVYRTRGERYVACVDFHAPDGSVYDVDYYVDEEGGRYVVEDVVLHRAGGENVLAAGERARLELIAGEQMRARSGT